MNNYMKIIYENYEELYESRSLYKPEFFSGFLFAIAKVVSITAMIYFLITKLELAYYCKIGNQISTSHTVSIRKV